MPGGRVSKGCRQPLPFSRATRASLVVALLQVVYLLPAGASSAGGLQHSPDRHAGAIGGPPTGAFSAGTVSQQPGPALRGQTWNTTPAGDGTYQTVLYADSVNYQGDDGTWQPIDDTLVAATAPGAAYQNRANRYTLDLPSDISTPVQVSLGKQWVSMALAGAKGGATVSGAAATYAEALPGVTVRYTAESDQVKEALTLASPASPATFAYTIQTSPGLTAAMTSADAVQVSDGSGNVAFTLDAPFMIDAAGAVSGAVAMSLGQGPGPLTLTLAADPKWLTDPARVWPVTIDPTVSVGPSQDCYIIQASPNTGVCSLSSLNVSNYPSGSLTRSLLQFDVASALPVPQVFGADLALDLTTETNTTAMPVTAYGLTQTWTGAVSWNKRDGIQAWTTPGGTYTTANSYTNSAVGGSTGWYHWYPTQLVQSWVNGSLANDGLLLTMSGSSPTNTFQFASSEYSDSTLRPSLTVSWAPDLGEQGYYTLVGRQLTDRMDLHVNVANGNLVLHESDLHVKGTGLDLSVDRYYNSASSALSDFGNRWVMGTGRDVGLTVLQSGSVIYAGPSGYQILFTKNPDGTFTSPTGIDATFTKPGSTYTLTFQKTGEKYNFSSGGFLTSDVDKSGNRITFTYNANNTLASIKDTQGRLTTFAYNASNLITGMTDPSGRAFGYGYEGSSNLTSYTDPAGGVTAFAYTGGSLTQITDPQGNQTRIAYDSTGRASTITYVTNPGSGAGYTTTFSYPTPAQTLVTDSNGHATEYDFDAQGRVTKIVDPLGNSRTYSYTSDSLVSQSNSGVGTTQYAYDSLNNLTERTEPTSTTTSWAYSSGTFPYYPTTSTDTQANMSSFSYDSRGNLTTVTDPYGHVTTYAYNANGTLATVTDARGNVTSYSYDAKGNLTSITYPAPLGPASFTYTLSRVRTATDGKGQTTRYTYDALDRVTSVTYADGTSVSFTYDADGNMTSMTDSTGTTTYAYNSLNRITSKTLPGGQQIVYGWDGEGNLVSETDAGGVTTYAYNPANFLISLTVDAQTTTFQYDSANRRSAIDYPNGVVVSFTRDTAGHITEIEAKKGYTVLLSRRYSYADPITAQQTDLIETMTDQVGNVTTYGYDALNRLASATVDERPTYSYSYDPVGNMTSKTVNGLTTTYLYNAANERTLGGGLSYTYDPNGNMTARSDGLALGYNAANLNTSATPPGGNALAYSYAGWDQWERVQAGPSSFVSDFRGVTQRATGGSSTFEVRDLSGSLLAERTPSGTYYVISDAIGSTIGLTNSQGVLVSTWTYDPWGVVTSSTGNATSPFLFGGAYLDQATGLYKMGSRYYDPSTGSWTQPDPLSQVPNFSYAEDIPTSWVDPQGLGGGFIVFDQCDPTHFAWFLAAVEGPGVGAVFWFQRRRLGSPVQFARVDTFACLHHCNILFFLRLDAYHYSAFAVGWYISFGGLDILGSGCR
jgi:RHS repeat-associated protein